MHDKTYILLVPDLLQSAVEQMSAELRRTGPAVFQTLAGVKGAVDLTSFKQRFAGNDEDLVPAFDDMTSSLVKVVFREVSLR